MFKNLHLISAIFFFLFFFSSCTTDSDVFIEEVLAQENNSIEGGGANSNPSSSSGKNSSGSQPSDFVEATPNEIIGVFTPKNSSEITNPEMANYKAIISESFECNECVLAPNLTIEPAGGRIGGKNIDLNNAFIVDGNARAFAGSVTFKNIYTKTRVKPELFGGVSNDEVPDDVALFALIHNVQYATMIPKGVYIKNQETVFTRGGSFDWDMNGAIVRTTTDAALSHGSDPSNEVKYLFQFDNLYFTCRNGQFDGNREASRLFYFKKGYNLELLNIHDYYAPPNAWARAVAISAYIDGDFADSFATNNIIRDIEAASDGNANNAPFGISKGFSINIATENSVTLNHSGNLIENISGDDAEGLYNAPNWDYGSYNSLTNGVQINLTNETFRACQRRAVKINASNVQIDNCLFESATNDWIFSGAQATLVHIFSIRAGQPISNVNVINSTISTVGDARNQSFGITDATNCLIENNTITANYLQTQRSIGIGNTIDAGGFYDGDLSNTVIFRNNNITNLYFRIGNVYIPVNGGPVIDNNTVTLNIDRGIGLYWAVFLYNGYSGVHSQLNITNMAINANMIGGTWLFNGLLWTNGQEPKNLTLNNVDLTYTGTPPTYAFGNLTSSFDNTNTIINCDMTGASGTHSLKVDGRVKGAQIISSFGNNLPITSY